MLGSKKSIIFYFNPVEWYDENTEPNTTQSAFTGDMHIDRNDLVVSNADHLFSTSFGRWFGSRGWWHFKTGTNKFYTSEVVDRKKSEVSRLYF